MQPLAAGLLHGPIDEHLQFAQVVGEVVALQPLDHRFRHPRRRLPTQLETALADAITQPFAQVLAPHPQGWHPDQFAAAIQQRRRRLGGEVHPASELPWPPPRASRLPLASLRQLLEGGLQGLRHPIELVDQQTRPSDAGQQPVFAITGHRAKQQGSVFPQTGPIDAQ